MTKSNFVFNVSGPKKREISLCSLVEAPWLDMIKIQYRKVEGIKWQYTITLSQIRITILFLLVILIQSCDTNKPENAMDNNKTEVSKIMVDNTPRVTGIGGIFFGTQNPQQTREWYGKNLGLAIDDHGSPFEFRNANNPEEINYLRWGAFPEGDEYFKPSKREFMINYRVQNIEGLVKKLKENGVNVVDTIATYDYGKFVHLIDLDGNKVELWEPVDSFLTSLKVRTTK